MSFSKVFSDIFDPFSGKVQKFLAINGGYQLATFAYSIAEEKIFEQGPIPLEYKTIDSGKVKEARNGLDTIIDRFDAADDAYSEFLDNFPKWSVSRRTTIKELNAIAESLHSDRFKGNLSKIVGGTVGALGGAAVVGSFLFPPLLLPLSVGGGIASVVGGGTVFGTSVTEIVLLKKRMKEAKTVLECDLQKFQRLQKWFDRSNDLMAAINRVLGFDLMERFQEEASSFLPEYRDLRSHINDDYMDRLRPLMTVLINLMLSHGTLLTTFGLDLAPAVISFVVTMFFKPMYDSCLLERISNIQRLTIGLLSGIDAGVEFGRVAAAIAMRGALKGAPAVAENVPKVLARSLRLGLFVGVGIALDVTNIVLTSIDLKKGSLSEQGKELKKAAEELEKEFTFLKEVYKSLKRGIF